MGDDDEDNGVIVIKGKGEKSSAATQLTNEHQCWVIEAKLSKVYTRKELGLVFLSKFDPHIGKVTVRYIMNKWRKKTALLDELECIQTFAKEIEDLLLKIDYACRSSTQHSN